MLGPNGFQDPQFAHCKKLRVNDPLNRRMYRMVQQLRKLENGINMNIPGTNILFDKSNHWLVRVFWVFLFMLCFALIMYQAYERWSYFRSQPISVNVETDEPGEIKFPIIGICSVLTPELLDIKEKLLPEWNGHKPGFTLFQQTNLTAEKIWDVLNTSRLVKSINIENYGPIPVEHRAIPTSLGTCAEIKIRTPIKFNPNVRVKISLDWTPGFSAPCFDLIEFSYSHSQEVGSARTASACRKKKSHGISIKKYIYVNRRAEPCSTGKQSRKCHQDCIETKLRQGLTQYGAPIQYCRLPFMDAAVKLPKCPENNDTDRALLYDEAAVLVQLADSIHDCGCPKLCYQTNYQYMPESYDGIWNETSYSIYLTTNRIIIVRERLIYDVISLLCDLGGLLGLYMGMSLVTLGDMYFSVAKYRKNRRNTYGDRDPIFVKVKKVYRDLHQKNKVIPVPKAAFPKVVMGGVTILCFLLSGWLIATKTLHFLSSPTENTIKITHRVIVEYPTFILCHRTKNLLNSLKLHAKRNKKLDQCSIDMLDVVTPSMTISKLWQRTNFTTELFTFKKYFNQSTTDYNMPDGNCYRIESFPVQYSKSFGLYMLMIQYTPDPCNKEAVKLYIVHPRGFLDLTKMVLVPEGFGSEVQIRLKRVDVSEIESDCDNEAEKNCLQTCLEQRLQKSINCSMPFIPQWISLPVCKTSEEAKNTTNMYRRITMLKDSDGTCQCPRACQTDIFEIVVATEGLAISGIHLTFVIFYFTFSGIETISTHFTYTLIKYLCDLGSIVGLLLGWSVLSIFDLMQSLIHYAIKKRSKN